MNNVGWNNKRCDFEINVFLTFSPSVQLRHLLVLNFFFVMSIT